MSRKYYDWGKTFSYQTGTQGEFCLVIGGKNIGKTFGIRASCIKRFLSNGELFVEICRTKDEKKMVSAGYFDKLQELNQFEGYIFRTTGNEGYIAKEPAKNPETGEYAEKPNWQLICYFVSLTTFQTEKKRTFKRPTRFIFDEAVIDRKDRYHTYLRSEYLVLANLLDSVSRQQPNGYQYRVYLLGNSCDLTCPYLRYLGIDKPPEYGYSFWNEKNTLLHYVEPWDAEDQKRNTVVGRMLRGMKEADMVFGNQFDVSDTGDIAKKGPGAKYAFAIKYADNTFSVWMDYGQGLTFVQTKMPKQARNVFTLTKRDASLDYQAVDKANGYIKSLNQLWYSGLMRFDSPVTRELFLQVLDFLGVR